MAPGRALQALGAAPAAARGGEEDGEEEGDSTILGIDCEHLARGTGAGSKS